MRTVVEGNEAVKKSLNKIIEKAKLNDETKRTKASYPSPADLESVGSKLSDVIEPAESGDIGKA